MLQSRDGFTFTEVLVAFHIVMVIVFTTAPIINVVYNEREVLYDRRKISTVLHDKLQEFIHNQESLPFDGYDIVNTIDVHFKIKFKSKYIQACASWTNVKEREESLCYHGIPSEK